MSATDTIRAMLDERGVEWMPSAWSARDETFYKVGNTGFLATEMSGGRMKVCIEGYVVPEQAVEATLGRGECKVEESWHGESEMVEYRCTACDEYMVVEVAKPDGAQPPNYCPNCGRKVKA